MRKGTKESGNKWKWNLEGGSPGAQEEGMFGKTPECCVSRACFVLDGNNYTMSEHIETHYSETCDFVVYK